MRAESGPPMQIECADFLVLNKMDVMPADRYGVWGMGYGV